MKIGLGGNGEAKTILGYKRSHLYRAAAGQKPARTWLEAQARTQELRKHKQKIEIEGTASNDTESIQIAPRDYQKLEF